MEETELVPVTVEQFHAALNAKGCDIMPCIPAARWNRETGYKTEWRNVNMQRTLFGVSLAKGEPGKTHQLTRTEFNRAKEKGLV